MSRNFSAVLTLGSTALLTIGVASPAEAVTQTVLHTFCRQISCQDGAGPQSPLLQDGDFLYGVTRRGGLNNNHGVVFRYTISTGAYKVLYNFCANTDPVHGYCLDGDTPNGGLIVDTSGNLYGTTFLGGITDAGMVYELVKPSGSGSWTLSALHTFTANSTDGNGPTDGLSYVGQATGTEYDGTSQLFGETIAGGGGGVGDGTVFTLRTSSGVWQEKVIRAFCPTCSANGLQPEGGLAVGGAGKLWGTTIAGGSANDGIAFKLVPGTDPWADPWTETVLYNFCWAGGTCTDGGSPSGVTRDAAGNLLGTGGPTEVLFELSDGNCTEGGSQTFWCNTVIHTFTNAQGVGLNGNVVIDSSGNIFGTSRLGGSSAIVSGGAGTVWKQGASAFSVLHKFCTAAGCIDGQSPDGGVIIDSSGNLYGTTSQGGDGENGDGVLYETTP